MARPVPLLWKVVAPFAALVAVVGTAGTVLVSRTLSQRADTDLGQQVAQLGLVVRSAVHERELYALESVNLAANLAGIAPAAADGDVDRLVELLRSVVAVKRDLGAAGVIDGSGRTIVAVLSDGAAAPDSVPLPVPVGRRAADVASVGGQPFLMARAPICSTSPCDALHFAAVAMPLETVITPSVVDALTEAEAGVALLDDAGTPLATHGAPVPVHDMPTALDSRGTRVTGDASGQDVVTLFAPLNLQGEQVGVFAVSLPSSSALSAARDAAIRFALVLLAVMVGIVAIAALVTRRILAQLRPLVETNRRLGAGDLAARAPVLSRDELGEVAAGVNAMAEQLEASYTTLERRVEERTAEVRRLMRERSDFFAAITHDLRTPLAVILGQARRIRGDGTGDTIRSAARQIEAMVEDVLELARAEEGRLVMDTVDFDVREVIQELQPTMSALGRAREVALELGLPETALVAQGDPVRVREIISNLVDNALKYTPAGGTVTVRATQGDAEVAVVVSDTGIGIPHEVGDDIFRPFFRVPGSSPLHSEHSTGLGLALARRLVEAQGGTLTYTSEPGRGSHFCFTLPGAAVRTPQRTNLGLQV